MPLGVSIMRTWSSPFGPLGTPLVDRDDPAGVIEDFFAMLARPHLKLPKVLVLPEVRLDGAVASLLGAVAETPRPARWSPPARSSGRSSKASSTATPI